MDYTRYRPFKEGEQFPGDEARFYFRGNKLMRVTISGGRLHRALERTFNGNEPELAKIKEALKEAKEPALAEGGSTAAVPAPDRRGDQVPAPPPDEPTAGNIIGG